MSKVRWQQSPEEHDFPAAGAYLCLQPLRQRYVQAGGHQLALHGLHGQWLF